MAPGNAFVTVVNAALADPDVRAQIRRLHAEGASLVSMVEALGLDGQMSGAIRSIVDGLPEDVVAGIREATLAMLDSDTHLMPLDCTVTDTQVEDGAAVDVDVVQDPSPMIRIRLSSAPG
jgi:hypothetical protein